MYDRWRMLGKTFVSWLFLTAGTVSAVAGTHNITVERHVVNVTGRERVGMLNRGGALRTSNWVLGFDMSSPATWPRTSA